MNPLTRPLSPNITKLLFRPPPKPQIISNQFKLSNINLSKNKRLKNVSLNIENLRKKEGEDQQYIVNNKDSDLFIFHESKYGLHRQKDDIISKDISVENEHDTVQFNTKFSNPMPTYHEPKLPIKLTTASILRDGHIIEKTLGQTNQMLNDYEINLRDATEFEAKKATLEYFDEIYKSKQVEMRRDLAKLSLEEARVAIISQIEKNQSIAREVRMIGDEILIQKQLDKENTYKERRIQAEKLVNENESKLKALKMSQVKERMLNGRTIRSERLRNERKILITQQLEEQEKILRAHTIKESVLHTRPLATPFDPTTAVHQGLLEEVPFQLLQERLEAERIRQQDLETVRRSDIEAIKSKKQNDLQKCTDLIMKARQKRVLLSLARKQLKRQQIEINESIQQGKLQKSQILNLESIQKSALLKASESEQQALKEEEIKRKLKELSLSSEQCQLIRESDFKKAQDRQLRLFEETKATDKVTEEHIHTINLKNRAVLKTQRDYMIQQKESEQQEKLVLAQHLKSIREQEDTLKKASLTEQVKLDEAKMKETMKQLNPYAEKISMEVKQDALKSRKTSKI